MGKGYMVYLYTTRITSAVHVHAGRILLPISKSISPAERALDTWQFNAPINLPFSNICESSTYRAYRVWNIYIQNAYKSFTAAALPASDTSRNWAHVAMIYRDGWMYRTAQTSPTVGRPSATTGARVILMLAAALRRYGARRRRLRHPRRQVRSAYMCVCVYRRVYMWGDILWEGELSQGEMQTADFRTSRNRERGQYTTADRWAVCEISFPSICDSIWCGVEIVCAFMDFEGRLFKKSEIKLFKSYMVCAETVIYYAVYVVSCCCCWHSTL